MFRRPPPEGGEHLTPFEQKWLRKMQRGGSLDRHFAAMKIRDKGSAAAFVVVLGHPRLDADWREIMTRMSVREKDAAYVQAIAPVIGMLGADAQGSLLAMAQEMDDDKRRAVQDAAANPQSWAAALYHALEKDEDAPLRAVCIEQAKAGNLHVHYSGSSLMAKALRHMRTDVVEALLPQFSFALYRDEIEKSLLTAQNADPAAKAYFEGLCRRLNVTAAPAAADDSDWRRLDATSVAQVTRLPDGGQLTMVFNFATRQQILLHQPVTGSAPAPVVVPFSQVEGLALEKAASLLPAGEALTAPAPMLRLGAPHV